MDHAVLFVPTRPRDGSGSSLLEMRTLTDGRLALPAYTSLERLTSCCGPQQPWIAIDAHGLRETENDTGYEVVLLDAAMPVSEQKHTSLDDDGDSPPASWLHNPMGRKSR